MSRLSIPSLGFGLLALTLVACAADTPPAQDGSAASTPLASSAAAVAATATASATPASENGAQALDGQFQIAGIAPGEAWIALQFDPVALSMDNEGTIRVKGRGTPAIDAAAEALTSINVETASSEAKRLIAACSGGCTLDGIVVYTPSNDWTLKTLRSATPHAQALPIDVAREDPRRKPLLDALRPQIETDLGQPLVFEVAHLRERNGSAFAAVHPRTKDGKPVNFANTRHAQRMADGVLDGDTVYAMLQYRDGRWQVMEFVIAPTDVAWTNWAQDYAAAAELFEMGE